MTPQDQLSGARGRRKRRGDSPGPWRKRRGDDPDGNSDLQPPKRSANNKVLSPFAALCLVLTIPFVPRDSPDLSGSQRQLSQHCLNKMCARRPACQSFMEVAGIYT